MMLDQATTNKWNSIKSTGKVSELSSLLFEIVSNDDFEGSLNLFNEIFKASNDPEWLEYLQELVIDIIWILELEYSSDFTKSNDSVNLHLSESQSMKNLIIISRWLVQNDFLPVNLLLERLEPEFLESIGVIASADLFNKKVVKINTAMYYKQQKFNLLREESEGFSRVIIFVSSKLNFKQDNTNLCIDSVYDHILEMIGFFSLDPLKVLDILIETFIFGISSWQDHLKLLQKFSFPSTSIIGILGFKLRNVYGDSKFSSEYLEQIMTVVSLLISERFIEIDQIWVHLSPSDDDCLTEFSTFKAKIRESSKKLGVVNLNSSNNSTSEAVSSVSPDSLTEQYAQDTLNLKLIPSLGSNRNLKCHLVLGLLSIGSISLAFKVLTKFPHLAALNHKISTRMCSVIEGLMQGDLECENDQFLKGKMDVFGADSECLNVSNWLNLLPKGGLFHSSRLFSKIMSLGATTELIISHLIPALACSSHDSLILSQELWNNYISTLPYAERYSIYGNWVDSFYETSLFGPLIKATSIAEARKVMRRLAKENVRQYGRLVAKVTHSNPVIVLPLILDQLQAYDNIIPAVVEAFRFLTPLSFDILIFSLLRALASTERDRLKEDGTNIASWLQNLSQFSSAIFRKYPHNLDPAPLLRYIYSQLLDDNCLDLVILQELLTHMAGIERPENLSEALIEVKAAGGPILEEEVRSVALKSLGLSLPSRRCLNRLKGSLESEQLTLGLLVALAQASDTVIYRMDYSHLKLVSTLTDTCHSSLLQYLEFLKTEFNHIIPDISTLVKVNRVELPLALFIKRTFSTTGNSEFNEFNEFDDLFRFYYKTSETNTFFPIEFLKTFWSLGLSDISVPMQKYQSEISRCSNATDASSSAALQQEMKEQVGKCGKTRETLMKVKDSWFSGSKERNQITGSILKMALLPRMLISPMEAVFSAKFLFHLHGLGPQHLSTLSLLDSIFDSLPAQLISTLTEAESHCFGRFFYEIFSMLQSWQQSREKYEREAIAVHLPGFMKRWSHFVGEPEPEESGLVSVEDGEISNEPESVDNADINQIKFENNLDTVTEIESLSITPSITPSTTLSTPSTSTLSTNENSLNWEDFRHVLFKWHRQIFKTVRQLLSSSDYCSVKNSIIFLSHQINGTFPRLEEDSNDLEVVVNEVKGTENREDLKVLATRYSAMLSQNKSKLLKEYQFHFCERTSPLKRSTSEIVPEIQIKRVKSSKDITSKDRKDKSSRSSENSRDQRDRDRESRDRESIDRELRDRELRDARSSTYNKDGRDNSRELRVSRDSKDTRESRDNRDTRESRDNRDTRESRDNRDTRESRESRDIRDTTVRDNRDSRDNRESRDRRDQERERDRDRLTRRDNRSSRPSTPSDTRSNSSRTDESSRSRRF